jgi:HD-GYP domain-containing protein (c-di-GMP phosphodiesterase class II)
MAELAETTLGHGSGHGHRVGLMAMALGNAIGLSPGDIEALDEAALLHDVGELTAGLDLVKAPRRLTAHELREVARHAEASFQVAQKCGAPRQALMAIRHHHERFDGRGYPSRLAGKEIPVTARVLAVADTFDALATGRPYRGRQSMHQCIKTLRQAAGVQLDPALVDLFLKRRLFETVDWLEPPQHEPAEPAVAPPRKRARAG